MAEMSRTERTPLLRSNSQSSAASSNSNASKPLLSDGETGNHEEETGVWISKSRGALIIGSIGLLIFITGT